MLKIRQNALAATPQEKNMVEYNKKQTQKVSEVYD